MKSTPEDPEGSNHRFLPRACVGLLWDGRSSQEGQVPVWAATRKDWGWRFGGHRLSSWASWSYSCILHQGSIHPDTLGIESTYLRHHGWWPHHRSQQANDHPPMLSLTGGMKYVYCEGNVSFHYKWEGLESYIKFSKQVPISWFWTNLPTTWIWWEKKPLRAC